MYGTVARLRAKPNSRAEIEAYVRESKNTKVVGMIASYVYRMDAVPDEYYLAVVFESKEAYIANADSPEQDARFHQLRALLVADPEWHDGDVSSILTDNA